MPDTLLADVVDTTEAVAATRARSTKVAALADLFARLDGDELPVVVAMLTGTVRTSALVVHQPERTRAAIRAAFDRLVLAYQRDGGGFALPVSAKLAVGRLR